MDVRDLSTSLTENFIFFLHSSPLHGCTIINWIASLLMDMYHFAHISVGKIPKGGIFALKDLCIYTFDTGLVSLHTQEECNSVCLPTTYSP